MAATEETTVATKSAPAAVAAPDEPEKNFRFYDNRQKYLMFVNTCSVSLSMVPSE